MKRVISAIIACVFVFAMATTAFAASSPIAPTINETTTQKPVDETTTQKPVDETTTQKPVDETTTKPDVDDETTTAVDETTTQKPVESDTNPSSPDTGAYVGKTVSAAAFVALALGGAVVYTSKKKAE